MMTDITHIIKKAMNENSNWTEEKVESILLRISKLKDNGYFEWEKGDEEWGRVISTGVVYAYVCARIPLVFILSEFRSKIKFQEDEKLFYLFVDDMSRPIFQVKKHLLEEVFERDISDSIEYNSLSIDDLWWATV